MHSTLIRYSTLIAGVLEILHTGIGAQNYTSIIFFMWKFYCPQSLNWSWGLLKLEKKLNMTEHPSLSFIALLSVFQMLSWVHNPDHDCCSFQVFLRSGLAVYDHPGSPYPKKHLQGTPTSGLLDPWPQQMWYDALFSQVCYCKTMDAAFVCSSSASLDVCSVPKKWNNL